MIPGSAVYRVVEAMAPLYTASVLGYASVRWLKAFSDEQCAGINNFAALYAAPVLIFHMVSTNDPYHMNERLIAADTLQKAVMLLALTAWALWAHFRRRRGGDGRLKWVVTNFSVASLPNTIVVGMPLLDGMYGSMSGGFLKQIVVMQFCVWYNVVIFLYEFIVLRESCAKMTPVLVRVAAENSDHILHIDENVGSIHAERGHPAENIEITEVAAASLTATDCASEDSITAVRKELSADRQAINGNNNKATEEGSAAVPPPAPATQQVPSVMRVLWMTGKKALSFPNTYASFLGLLWSLIAFRFGIKMPKIVDDSLFAIYTTTVGLSMFASGAFIARQPQLVSCGYAIASLSLVLKFLVGPVVMLLTSLAVGLHGTVLHIAVVQAALPLSVSSFVYAAEYMVHVDVMTTGVILGVFISLPVTIAYYIMLG